MVDALNNRYTRIDSNLTKRQVHELYHSDWTKWTFIALIIVHMFFVVFERPSFKSYIFKYSEAEQILLWIELGIVVGYALLTSFEIYLMRFRYFKSPTRMLVFMIIISMFIDVKKKKKFS